MSSFGEIPTNVIVVVAKKTNGLSYFWVISLGNSQNNCVLIPLLGDLIATDQNADFSER